MKRFVLGLGLGILLVLIFHGSRSRSIEISDINLSLRHQFEKQWAEKKEFGDSRSIKDVQINRFFSTNGNAIYSAEIMILWSDVRQYSTSPLVPLGASTSAVSIEVPNTKQQLSAVIVTR